MNIKFKKLDQTAVIPTKEENSAGYGLTCTGISTKLNKSGQVCLIYHCGLSVDIPEGYYGELRPMDNLYTNSIRMCNFTHIGNGEDKEIVAYFVSTTDVVPSIYNVGEKFAQLFILPNVDVEWEEVVTEDLEGGTVDENSTSNQEESAIEGETSPLETEGIPTNSNNTEAMSGGEENIPEQV